MVLSTGVLFLLLLITQIDRCSSHVWSNQQCSPDPSPDMPEGIIKNMDRFPWLGVLQHGFTVGGKTRYAITSAVLIHSLYAVAAAEDVSKIPIETLPNNTKLFFWGRPNARELYSLDVKDYILHPQFKSEVTYATIALLSLIGPDEHVYSNFRAPVLPVCLPLSGGNIYEEMYAVKLTDENGDLEKKIARMTYVDSKNCEEFYFKNKLYSQRYNPINPLCAMSMHNRTACVWDSGAALLVRQNYGFWQLIGLSVRGPGCGAPTKFINVHDYLPWINDVIRASPRSQYSEEFRIGIRRASPMKLIMFNPEAVPENIGMCDREHRGNVIYKDWGEFIVNKDFCLGFYLMVVTGLQSLRCGEVKMVGANQRSNAAIWMDNDCHPGVHGSSIPGQLRSGNESQLACFVFFKTNAFIEFRFAFSFQIVVSAVLYGQDLQTRDLLQPTKTSQHTTPWWPTWDKLKFGLFASVDRWWYFQ